MARSTPTVQGDCLSWSDEYGRHDVLVGSPEWFAWLEQGKTFSFFGLLGSFTARRDRVQRGGWYWKAYRNRGGKLQRAYLGKGESLTLERLNRASAELMGASPNHSSGLGVTERADWKPGAAPPSGLTTLGAEESGVPPIRALSVNRKPRQRPAIESTRWDPLIKTKLILRASRRDLVERPRLYEQLAKAARHKLTLISAPAGSGKTTVLTQWIGRHEFQTVSVALDPRDNDPVRYWAYFVAAIQKAYPRFGEEVLLQLRSSPTPRAEAIARSLVNALADLPDELVVVLDEYEVIEDQAVQEGMRILLEYLPPHVHLVISSRADPPLPLARLRARGELSELRAPDLCFTVEETNALLNGMVHLSLTPEEVDALVKRTEGWAAGLQLAAISLRRSDDPQGFIRSFSGDHHHILDYLLDEVFRRLPEDLQTFLLDTSILERLCAPLCEAVTGWSNGQATLEMLDRTNLFTVPLDNEHCWYRYHKLFADFLRSLLRQRRPEHVPELHRLACDWYERQGLNHEAIGHALAAGEFGTAARLVEQTAGSKETRSEVATLLGWIRALPEEIIIGMPRLCLLHAWALSNVEQFEAADARLRQVEQQLEKQASEISADLPIGSAEEMSGLQILLEEIIAIRTNIALYRGEDALGIALSGRPLQPSVKFDRFMSGAMTQILGSAYWLNGDFARASHLLTQCIALNRASGDVPNTSIALAQLARLQVFQGRLREAAENYRQALQLARSQGGEGNGLMRMPLIGLGWIYYEWNDLDTAIEYVTRAIALAQEIGSTSITILGLVVLARIRQATGDIAGAFDVLRQAEDLPQAAGLPQNLAQVAAYRARLCLAQGNLQPAVLWAQTSGLGVDDALSYRQEAKHMTLARVSIAQGRVAEAVGLLERLLAAAESAGRTGSVIKILVLLALARRAQGETAQALAAVTRALTLAEPEGYVRTFIDAGPSLARLLSEVLKMRPGESRSTAGAPPAYVHNLLKAFDPGSEATDTADAHVRHVQAINSILSKREREILAYVAAGRTNAQIADELVVALTTVKTHLDNIYRKLGVRNRVQAVAQGRELRLIP